jgi:hypothetical protein
VRERERARARERERQKAREDSSMRARTHIKHACAHSKYPPQPPPHTPQAGLRGIPRGEKKLVKDGIDGLKFRTVHIWPRYIGYVESKPEIVESRPAAATSVSRYLSE